VVGLAVLAWVFGPVPAAAAVTAGGVDPFALHGGTGRGGEFEVPAPAAVGVAAGVSLRRRARPTAPADQNRTSFRSLLASHGRGAGLDDELDCLVAGYRADHLGCGAHVFTDDPGGPVAEVVEGLGDHVVDGCGTG
jgi:hypothetical protein